MIITIDGPAASGKSSIAQELAKQLGLYHLKTGLLYRAVAYILVHELRMKINWNLPVEFIAEDLNFIKDIKYEFAEGQPCVFFKNNDITQHLSLSSLDQIASIVSVNKAVRDSLLYTQRKIAEQYNIVADGRDCGSVVFPGADYKFFLTASTEERAKRLLADENRSSEITDIEIVKREIDIRDKRDRERVVAPLIIPDDAIIIDSSNLSFSQTVQAFLSNIQR